MSVILIPHGPESITLSFRATSGAQGASPSVCFSAELQERRAELCGSERDQQPLVPHRRQ